jgi:hypothetical protein
VCSLGRRSNFSLKRLAVFRLRDLCASVVNYKRLLASDAHDRPAGDFAAEDAVDFRADVFERHFSGERFELIEAPVGGEVIPELQAFRAERIGGVDACERDSAQDERKHIEWDLGAG